MNKIRKTIETGKQDNFIMLPTVDFCFKELMHNPKVRQGIIASILKVSPEEIQHTKLLPTILRKQHKNDKFGILDIRVKLKDGTQIDIEMQVAFFEFWENRSIYYLSKMYTEQIQAGEEYNKLKKCIHVSILIGTYFPEDDRCYRKITFCDTQTGKIYSDLMEMHILELSKLPPEAKNEDGIILWMRFLSGKCEEDFEKMAKKDEYIGEAYEVLKNLSADEKKRIAYEYREKSIRDYKWMMKGATKRGHEEGFEEGMEKGILEGKSEFIINMNVAGYPASEIAKIANMSEKQVEEILQANREHS